MAKMLPRKKIESCKKCKFYKQEKNRCGEVNIICLYNSHEIWMSQHDLIDPSCPLPDWQEGIVLPEEIVKEIKVWQDIAGSLSDHLDDMIRAGNIFRKILALNKPEQAEPKEGGA